jgi:enolase
MPLRSALRGMHAREQQAIDRALIALDGTENKSKLGANAILGVSLAVARRRRERARAAPPLADARRASAAAGPDVQRPQRGAHADNSVDFQEFMIAPVGPPSFREAARAAAEVYQALKALLKQRGFSTAIGDEGGVRAGAAGPTVSPP